jgi:ribulose-bisphosphate carboxylase large chain
MGKMAGETEENDLCRDALREEWGSYKRVFPVASGGVYPAKVHGNLGGYGIDCIVQAGAASTAIRMVPPLERGQWCRRRRLG